MLGGVFRTMGGGGVGGGCYNGVNGGVLFRCEAVYLGRRAVLGAQSTTTLTLLVEHLISSTPHAANPHAHHDNNHTYAKLRSERCQLQCDDERLQVTPIRKDEGFESDSESSGSTCDESFCGNQDIKVISDHVLRLDHLIHHDAASSTTTTTTTTPFGSDDSSSSATSSGNESEDDSPRTTNQDCLGSSPNDVHSQMDGNVGSISSSAGGGIGDTFLISDILYCHVAPATPRVVVVVVKDAGSSQVYAHVFQCLTEEAARTLYANYKEASNKYKLNRYRNSKRKSDTNSAEASNTGVNAAVCRSSASSKPPSGLNSSFSKASGSISRLSEGSTGRGSLRSVEARLLKGDKRGDIGNNVNVIEIREASQQDNTEEARPWNLVQHTDANGVTHIEIESGPCSLVSSSSDTSDFNSLLSVNGKQQGQLSSLTTLPSQRSDTAENNSSTIQGSNSCPNSLISTEREVLVAGEVDKKNRQRQPAKLLKDLIKSQDNYRRSDDRLGDEKQKKSEGHSRNDYRREERRNREENRRDEQREGRSRRGRHEVELRGNSDRDIPVAETPTVDGFHPGHVQERQSRPREQSRSRFRHSHNKGPAPPPPPRRHPNNPSLLLVPTKSGAENARAFYPKESHIIRGNKIVRVEYPGYTSGWIHHDINNNPHHYNYYTHGNAWVGPHEYHAVRPRESTITNEMRRRSRSKSPARRPMAHRYIDAVSTFNLSQKLKDISEAVFTGKWNNASGQNSASAGGGGGSGNNIQGNGVSQGNGREGRGHQRSMSSVSASVVEGMDGTLKSVIKKGRKVEASPQTRRVTFSAYATVQVMEA